MLEGANSLIRGSKLKNVFLAICLLTTISAEAREGEVVVLREPQAAAELVGFSESIYGRADKACFYGSITQVCSEAKATIKRLNLDLSMAGATQRFKVEACAHNPEKAMILFSTISNQKSAKTTAESKKSLYLGPCQNGEPRKIVVSFAD